MTYMPSMDILPTAVLSEWKLAARCCELLSEAMRTFPELPSVQTWAAYALYQLAAYHSESPRATC